MCDIHIEEMHRCFIEYDSFKLKQAEIEAMLECFLESLWTSANPQLIKRIKSAVFDKLIEHNGP